MIPVDYDISCGRPYFERLVCDVTGFAGAAIRPGFMWAEPQKRADRPKANMWRTIMTDLNKESALSWTDERVELLRKLWLDGLSASRIAAELAGGVTRNAVIGKVHRLGLSGRVKAPATASARPRPAAKAPNTAARPLQNRGMPQTRGNTALAVQPRPMSAPYHSTESNVVPMMENVTIMDLRESMCRWPVGDPASSEFRYCGGKSPIGEGPYCAYHSRMAYQPTHDRHRRKIA